MRVSHRGVPESGHVIPSSCGGGSAGPPAVRWRPPVAPERGWADFRARRRIPQFVSLSPSRRPTVGFDANLSALAYNLRRLGSLCASNAELARRAAEAVAAALATFVRRLLGPGPTTPNRPHFAAAA